MTKEQKPEDRNVGLSAGLDAPPIPWRCFHCDEVFTDWGHARNHFGYSPDDGAPTCRTTRGTDAEIYHLKRRLALYQEEDTDLHREIAKLQADRGPALMRAEEDGYAKGLRDGRAERASNAGTKRPASAGPL
jgi:hypothetical protein